MEALLDHLSNSDPWDLIPAELKTPKNCYDTVVCIGMVRSPERAKLQIFELCDLALQHDPQVYAYIIDKTDQIKWCAVKHDPSLIDSMCPDYPPGLAEYVIERDPFNIGRVYKPSTELCMKALRLNGLALQMITHATDEMIYAAIENTVEAIQVIPRWTVDIGILIMNQWPDHVDKIPRLVKQRAIAKINSCSHTKSARFFA